jgi:hypothetical protein
VTLWAVRQAGRGGCQANDEVGSRLEIRSIQISNDTWVEETSLFVLSAQKYIDVGTEAANNYYTAPRQPSKCHTCLLRGRKTERKHACPFERIGYFMLP